MKPYANCNKTFLTVAFTACLFAFLPFTTEAAQPTKVAVVNFKECVEHSKFGKAEQEMFNKMKKEAEESLKGKESELSGIANKLNDADYMDGLSSNAEKELKEQYRTLNQDLARKQQAAYQALTQANYLIAQKLTEEVTKAAEEVAKKEGYDIVLNQDACFYSSTAYNITGKVVAQMDKAHDKKEGK
jgi:outer membrane protein